MIDLYYNKYSYFKSTVMPLSYLLVNFLLERNLGIKRN